MSLSNGSCQPASQPGSAFSVNPNSIATEDDPSGRNFVDRRSAVGNESGRPERRQFGSSHYGLSDDGRELALAIDEYKIQHHRRYLTCDEMLKVLTSLGYAKQG